jgi:hypothetical protein
MKPENVNLVKFEETENGYYATFKVTGLDKTTLNNLKKGIDIWKKEIKERGSKLTVKGNNAYLTDFFTKDAFESEYPCLVDIGMEKKLPERIDGELLSINVDLAMMEQDAEWVINMCSTIEDEERLEKYGPIIDNPKIVG